MKNMSFSKLGCISSCNIDRRSGPKSLLEIITTLIRMFDYNFSGFGTSNCCSRIRVTLSGVVENKQGQYGRAGTYQKASGLENNRSYWNQIDGDQALWWDNSYNNWNIESSSDLGSTTADIYSVQDSSCPTSDNLFKYHIGDNEFVLAPINSVSIQCV